MLRSTSTRSTNGGPDPPRSLQLLPAAVDFDALLHVEGNRHESRRLVLSRSQQHSIRRPGCCKSVPRLVEALRRRKMGNGHLQLFTRSRNKGARELQTLQGALQALTRAIPERAAQAGA